MRGIYIQQNSPHYWIRYYDKLEQDPGRKRRSLNTKIQITSSDRKRYLDSKKKKEKPKYRGNPDLKKFLAGFRSGLNERYIKFKHGIRIIKDLKLSEGLEEFKKERSIPGSKKELKQKTLQHYDVAVNHMINACGNKKIYKYSDEDYVTLLFYFQDFKIPSGKKKNKEGEWEIKYRPMSVNTRSVHTRTLRALWNYFLHKKYTAVNIIEVISQEDKEPAAIPTDDIYTIITYFKENKKYPHHYWIIYFMLLTGCRPSSAIVQLKEEINYKNKTITIRNIKSGKRKGKELYRFPLYNELRKLLQEEMNVNKDDQGWSDLLQIVFG
jgi:integrase